MTKESHTEQDSAQTTKESQTEQDSNFVKYTADDAKKRAPAWARKDGRSLEEQRAKWRQPEAPPGYEYAWRGTTALPATTNLSALLTLDLMEASDVDAAVHRVFPALSDELFVILVHCIYEMKQTFIKGRPSSGRAFRVDANLDTAAKYQAVLDSWNSQRSSSPSEATQRVALFIRDVADSVARPLTKKYSRSSNSIQEALSWGVLEQTDLPLLHQLVAATCADIQAPPCSKFQSLRLALRHIQECEAEGSVTVTKMSAEPAMVTATSNECRRPALQNYVGEYFFGGNKQGGSIYVTEAGKTNNGVAYNAPVDDVKDFPAIVTKEDLKDALWVWLPGNNGYNGNGWYLHDTIYKVQQKSPTLLVGYTGDMQRLKNGQPSPNQAAAELSITRKGNTQEMFLGGGFGTESWVMYLGGSSQE